MTLTEQYGEVTFEVEEVFDMKGRRIGGSPV
jgi:hypothetical protein